MNANKITVVEPLCERFEHSKFNSLFVSSLALASGANAEIEFWGEAEHCTHIANQLDEDIRPRVRFRPFRLATRIRNRRARVLAFLVTAIIRSLPAGRKTIFLSSNTPVIYATVLFRSMGPRRYIIHSYFPFFLRLLEKWKAAPTSALFRKLVLERSVFISLRSDILPDAISTWSQIAIDHVEHPIGKVRPRQHPASGKTIIGFLGRTTADKGFDLFETVSRKIQSPNIEFVHVGPAPVANAPSGALPAPSQMQLSDAEFEQQLRRLSFVFFANRRDSYKFIASGVVFEAIENSVPIVGVRDSYIDYLERKYSPLGYFFETPEELENGLEALVCSDPPPPAAANRRLVEACSFDAPAYLARVAALMELERDNRHA